MQSVEKGELAEYGRYLSSPGRVVLVNFLGGVARGVGIAIGFTLVAAITLYLLTKLAALNIPVIGAFIADITRIVQYQLRVH
ncbi:MAG: signal transduction histidine kinase [Firmicutes bacterium]|nr:signal transduction histidine kinase [Bacillota bacterium]